MIQNNEMQTKYIVNAVNKNLGENNVLISKFFEHIFSEGFDCIIFVSRRCYIIYLIFAIIEKWEHKKVFVCTDLGVFANRNKLLNCKKIAIVDDVGYTGASVRNILRKIKKYVSHKCEIVAIMYALNKRNASQIIRKGAFGSKRSNIKSRFWLTELQCKQLSIRLVNTILESGMPYTTFVYPLMGKLANDIDNIFIIHDSSVSSERKWKTQYLNILDTEENKRILSIGDYGLIRAYKNKKDLQMVTFLPFIFLKSIRADKIDVWYCKIAQTFLKMDSPEFAKEIYDALATKEKWKPDAIVYLACFFSCFCSKALAELCELRQYLEEYNKSAERTFEGSFSVEALKVIQKCDKKYAIEFFDELFKDKKSICDIFNNTVKRDEKLLRALKKYINDQCSDKNTYETTSMIYSWLKGKDSDKFFEKGDVKAVYLDDLIYVMKAFEQYKEEDIFLAQIECWDLGIATYRFYFDKRKGLLAKCTAGEMSATVEMVKYQYIIREFFNKRYCFEEPYVNMERSVLLNSIMEEALKEGKYTESEMANFRKIIDERNGSLFGLLI